MNRIATLQKQLKQFKADAFFCTSAANIFYLSGFQGLSPEERESSLLVTQSEVFLYLPKMYEENGKNLDNVKNGSIKLVIDTERDGLLHLFKKSLPKTSHVIIESENLTLSEFDRISEESELELTGASNIIELFRLHKDTDEKKKITLVVRKTDAVFDDIVKFLTTTDYASLTELDVADKLRFFGRQHGLKEFSFEPIVACGPGSSEPHYHTGLNKLQKGNILLMDFGFKYEGYCSDLTRCVFLGKADENVKNIYKIVLECNKRALAECKIGVATGKLHSNAVTFFEKHNLDSYFIHGLGHGVGIDIHEEPFFRIDRTTKLEKGMVVTIEPGIYLPGKFGIRIEDYVIMGKAEAEVLSTSPKELIEII